MLASTRLFSDACLLSISISPHPSRRDVDNRSPLPVRAWIVVATLVAGTAWAVQRILASDDQPQEEQQESPTEVTSFCLYPRDTLTSHVYPRVPITLDCHHILMTINGILLKLQRIPSPKTSKWNSQNLAREHALWLVV